MGNARRVILRLIALGIGGYVGYFALPYIATDQLGTLPYKNVTISDNVLLGTMWNGIDLDHALRLVTGRAEERLPASPNEREMVAELMHRWTSERPSTAMLESELLSLQTRMRALFDRIFAQ